MIQVLPLTDPRSFAVPIMASSLIVLAIFVLMSTQWVDTNERIIKTPKHINATLVVEKSKPKQAKKETVKKAVKEKPKAKPAPQKTPVANKAKTQAKKEVKPKVTPKPEPKALPLPGSDFSDAMLEEEKQMSIKEMLEEEEAAKAAEEEAAAVADISTQIRNLVQSVWRQPPSAKHTDEVVLRITLVPTGEVTDVFLVSSSGNPALDRSVEQAVWKVAKLPVPKDPVLFEKQFRQFNFLFRPEDARL